MATISSMLKLMDGFSRPIELCVGAMGQMVNTMEAMNREAKVPGLEQKFAEIRTGISLADHSLDAFKTELGGIDGAGSVAATTSNFRGLSSAIIVANQGLQLMQTLWGGINKLGDMADKRISVDARLNLINDGSTSPPELENKVMSMANNSRADYSSSAAMVAKMGRQDVFAGDNDKAIRFTEVLNKGLVISGASASEANGALTQLTQGLASGVMRGDEFNSIMENAPVLAEMMTKSLGVTKGGLRAMAEEGKLTTDVVVSSIMEQAGAIDAQFGQMPVTFGQAKVMMGNHVSDMMNTLSKPGMAVDVLITKVEEFTAYLNTPPGTAMMAGVASGITFVVNCAVGLFSILTGIYTFVSDNWQLLGPIFGTLAIAIGGVTAATLIYNGVTAASSLIHTIGATAKAAFAVSTVAGAAATGVATGAQWGLNAALLACPITWIIVAIILVIGLIYLIVGAINQFTGSTISATGVICGSISTVVAVIVNIIMGVVKTVMGVVEFFFNAFAAVGNFLSNVFTDPVAAVIHLIGDMANAVLSIIRGIAQAIDTIFGTNLASGVQGWMNDVDSWADEAAAKHGNGQYKQAFEKTDFSASLADAGIDVNGRMNYGDTYNSGYQFGQGIDDKLGGLFKLPPEAAPPPKDLNEDGAGGLGGGNPTGGNLDSVGKIDNAVDISDQSIIYLRDIAELAALSEISAYATVTYQQMDELRLSDEDANALADSANSDARIYYLNYSGGVHVKADVKQGEDWESIKRQLHDEMDEEIDSGLSGIDEVVCA